jgi:diguanylate cyclase (GGDEF)-like protein/PAS domain S-box-containing protein
MTVQMDTESLAAWSEVVRALPTPAALVDLEGRVVTPSRWLELDEGEPLVQLGDEHEGIVLAVDGETKWRVRPVRAGGDVCLATPEQFGTGDYILRRFFAGTDKLYVVYDQIGRAIEWNSAWTRILGYSDDEMTGIESWKLLAPDDLEMRSVVEKELRTRGRSEPSWRMRAADGSYRVIQWLLLFDPTVGRCFGVGTDVSDVTKTSNAELHRRAYTDDLTGLASRTRIIAELDGHLRNDAVPAVLFCDLDQFKVVNDSLGHAVGDRLLAALGERLSSMLDRPDVMVGRLGGDEFAVVIGDGGLEAAERAAEQAFEAISREFAVVGRSVKVGMSVGICVADPEAPQGADVMFERADMAVYKAKEDGRNRSVVYGPELQQRVDRRFELEAALRRGLDRKEFEPWFQPIMNIGTNQIVGVEALLRWRRDGTEAISPDAFHDVAIETGLITPIGKQVIDRALSDFGTMGSLQNEIWLTLNVSARELADDGFTEWFVDRVGAAGLRPSQVVIEITESVAIEEHALSDQLTILRALGFRIALDDFGTGHSSLAHLRTLPIDMVKIDRSFVADLVDDHTTGALTRSVVDLCRALHLSVIFEGVETQAESAAVVQSGGEYAQGFLFSRPLPVTELQWRTVGAELARRLANKAKTSPRRAR